ncbi:hypothetical protein WJX73_008612 [Symbiochloris irregularis]|uniref:GAF domain-containing protein n=1 Tax=Symbiochloris irregularis TaxID=706552 RepID=A0AAW1PN11_9CHLO
MYFVTHNYVFPRGIGAIDWCLLPEMKQVLVYDHLHEDIRFRDDELVKLCKWAAVVPLVASNGHRVGALGAFKSVPSTFSAVHYGALVHIGELLMRELERDALVQPGTPQHARLAKQAHRAAGLVDVPPEDRPYHVLEAMGPPHHTLHHIPAAGCHAV